MYDFYYFSHLHKESNITHAISSKNPKEPYNFSLALHTGENPSQIVKNRKHFAKILGNKNYTFIVANQTHSDHIAIISNPISQGWTSLESAIEDCDALITDQKNIVLTILTADCVPILLYDPNHEIIAIVHAGWKGTLAQIAQKTVVSMCKNFGSQPQDILAGIAPSIGKCCYEVGDDVATHFSHLPYAYTAKNEKYMLDLPMINQQQLLQAGLALEHIEMSQRCTACEVERFFSYRKEDGCTGRFMSMIVLEENQNEN